MFMGGLNLFANDGMVRVSSLLMKSHVTEVGVTSHTDAPKSPLGRRVLESH